MGYKSEMEGKELINLYIRSATNSSETSGSKSASGPENVSPISNNAPNNFEQINTIETSTPIAGFINSDTPRTQRSTRSQEVQTDLCLQHFNCDYSYDSYVRDSNLNITLKTSSSVSLKLNKSNDCNLWIELNSRNTGNTSGSSASTLDKILTMSDSKYFMNDLDNCLGTIHKFMKSKKYNSVTKKYYFKKIMKKITEQNLSTDSEQIPDKSDMSETKINDNSDQLSSDKLDSAMELTDVVTELEENKTSKTEENPEEPEIKPLTPKLDQPNVDDILKFAEDQRKDQLSWLNNEILYLKKFKELLLLQNCEDHIKTILKLLKSSKDICKKTKDAKIISERKKLNDNIEVQKTENDKFDKIPEINTEVVEPLQEIINEKIQCENNEIIEILPNTEINLKSVEPPKIDELIDDKIVDSDVKIQEIRETKSKVSFKTRKFGGNRVKKRVIVKIKQTKPVESKVEDKDGCDKNKYLLPVNQEKIIDKENLREELDNRAKPLTLQEYLRKNKPEFIQSADWRKNILNEIKNYRKFEESKKCKDLPHLYNTKELKDITKKIYKKLPETQSKITFQKREQQKVQNKIVAEVFSKNLQRKALEGRVTLPITTVLIK